MTRVKINDGNELKVGDTDPPLDVDLVKNNGVAQDLTGYTVTFKMREANEDTNSVDSDSDTGDVSIEDAAQGQVQYDWQSGDTDTAATYEAEFTIDDGAGSTKTFPNQGFFNVYIEDGL